MPSLLPSRKARQAFFSRKSLINYRRNPYCNPAFAVKGGNHLNLHQRILWQTSNFNRGTRWRNNSIERQVFPIDRIHRREIVHVLQEDGRLEDLRKACPSRLE